MAEAVTAGLTTIQAVTLVATSSVLAAALTQGLVWLKDHRGETKEGKFSALYIALAFEDYARACASVIGDNRTFASSRGAAGDQHGNLAELPEFPSVNWKALGITDTEKAMAFRTRLDGKRAGFSFLWTVTDEDSIIPDVCETSAILGLEALELGTALRRARGLKPLDETGEYSTRNYLTEQRERDLERARELAEYRARKRAENPDDPFI